MLELLRGMWLVMASIAQSPLVLFLVMLAAVVGAGAMTYSLARRPEPAHRPTHTSRRKR